MKILNTMILLCASLLLASCFTTRAVNDPEDRGCKLVTRELELEFQAGELNHPH